MRPFGGSSGFSGERLCGCIFGGHRNLLEGGGQRGGGLGGGSGAVVDGLGAGSSETHWSREGLEEFSVMLPVLEEVEFAGWQSTKLSEADIWTESGAMKVKDIPTHWNHWKRLLREERMTRLDWESDLKS